MATSLVNEAKLFSSIVTRLFTGSVREIVEELLQNAQRAGTTRVDVRFLQHSVVFHDNGHGLVNGVEDVRAMLVLAESSYQDDTVLENQSPMGIGLYALIAHQDVELVMIKSGSVSFRLNTQRWLHESAYRQSWQQRVEVLSEPEEGFTLTILARPSFLEQVRACLSIQNEKLPTYYEIDDYKGQLNPVSGYSGLMAVYLDGEQIIAPLPKAVALPAPHYLVSEYHGNEIHISPFHTGRYTRRGCLVVNWYGQLIFDLSETHKFCAYLLVRQGKPVTPRAPTRAGLIDDEAKEALWAWIEDRIFETICGMEHPPASLVSRLYAINKQRAHAACPFALVQRWLPLSADCEVNSYHDYVGIDTDEPSQELDEKRQVVRKDALDSLLLLAEGVTCLLRGDHRQLLQWNSEKHCHEAPGTTEQYFTQKYEIGLGSFLRATGLVAHKPVLGVPHELVAHFVWQPGEMADDYHTTDLGRWAIWKDETPEDESQLVQMLAWHPFGAEAAPLFVASETESYDIANIAWIIGLGDEREMVPFLKQYAHMVFVCDDENADRSEEQFDESVQNLILSYLPETISDKIWAVSLPGHCQQFLPAGYQAEEASYRFGRKNGQRCVTLRFADGFEKEISFY